MFFVLSKTLGYLLLPTNFLIAIGFVGAILMVTRFASLGRKLVIVPLPNDIEGVRASVRAVASADSC